MQPRVERSTSSGRRDSNSGPHRPERCALPGCATPRRGGIIAQAAGPAGRSRAPRRDGRSRRRRPSSAAATAAARRSRCRTDQPVDLEDLDRAIDLGQDPPSQTTPGRARERLAAQRAGGRREVSREAALKRHALVHPGSIAHATAGPQRVGWWDHPFGRYGTRVAGRDEIVAFAGGLLQADAYPDALPVGLQVTGADEVTRIATGVSASLELFRRAADAGAQMLIVHHGLFWNSDPRRIGARERARLRACSRPTSRSSPTTSPSTRTRTSATTPCCAACSASTTSRSSARSAHAASGSSAAPSHRSPSSN